MREHYGATTVDVTGTMDAVHLKSIIKPLALLSYRLVGFPVPHAGKGVDVRVHNRIDESGEMHWGRMFSQNSSFPANVTFASHMVYLGDHKVIEYVRFGLGAEAVLSVERDGSLVYEMCSYVVRMPFFGFIVRLPTWLSVFGRGRTVEIGETSDSFRVEFEMTHPLFGRTLGYAGTCRIQSVP